MRKSQATVLLTAALAVLMVLLVYTAFLAVTFPDVTEPTDPGVAETEASEPAEAESIIRRGLVTENGCVYYYNEDGTLFTLLEQQAEPMYLLRDSHWNGKGACLVYNAIMDTLDLPHEDYASTEPGLVKNENGDLNRMLYSFYGPLEENDSYNLTQEYTLTSSTGSVEDGWIVTENPGGTGTLLMFRDSFANTLIPFLSNEFETAYYAKGEPNALWRYVEAYGPDCVVIEKVERNISNYLENPPILPMPEGTLPQNITIAETATTARIAECLYDPSFYMLSGTVDEARMQTDSEILVCVNGRVCQAYQTGGNSYALYLKKEDLPDAEVQVQVYIVNGNLGVQALWDVLELPR